MRREAVTNQDGATGRPTTINLGEPGYGGSGADFVIRISQADTSRFVQRNQYFGKTVCVTGKIESEKVDRGNSVLPFIVARTPDDIEILKQP
jgi:hypothetical protein